MGSTHGKDTSGDPALVTDTSRDPAFLVAFGVDVSHVATGEYKWVGICSVEGKLYCAPNNSDKLLIYDTVSGALSGVDVSRVATGGDKWSGICSGICSVEHKVYCAPYFSDQLLIYDTVSGAVSGVNVSHVAAGGYKWSGICSVEGKVYCAPHCTDQLLTACSSHDFLRMPAQDFVAYLNAHGSRMLVRGDTQLHFAARIGHVEGCKALVDLGAPIKIPNQSNHLPRDVAQKSGHADVVRYFDELASFTETRGGSGDALDAALQDSRDVIQISWYTIPLRGTVGLLGGLHSFLAVEVKESHSSSMPNIYILEKAATDQVSTSFANGVFVSYWKDVVHCIEGDPLHRLPQEGLQDVFTMRDIYDKAVSMGQYHVLKCNCHHAALEVYNSCARVDYGVTSMPNSIIVRSAELFARIGIDVSAWQSPASNSAGGQILGVLRTSAPLSRSVVPEEDGLTIQSIGLQCTIVPTEDDPLAGDDNGEGEDLGIDSTIATWIGDMLGDDGAEYILGVVEAVAHQMPVIKQVLKAAQSVHAKHAAKAEVSNRIRELARTVAVVSERLALPASSSMELQMCKGYLQEAKEGLDEICSVRRFRSAENAAAKLKDISDTLHRQIGLMADLKTLRARDSEGEDMPPEAKEVTACSLTPVPLSDEAEHGMAESLGHKHRNPTCCCLLL